MDESLSHQAPGADEAIDRDRQEEGPFLVIRRGARLHDRCLCCGEPAAGNPLIRRVTWLPFYWYFTILIGVLPYVLAEFFVTRRSTLRFVLCTEHRARSRVLLLRSWLVVLIGGGFLLFSFFTENTVCFFVGLGTLIALEAYRFIGLRRLVHRIDDRFVWLRRGHLGHLFVGIFPGGQSG